MIKLERIRMRLPSGFEHRARSITQRVCEVLSMQSVSQDVSIDAVSITPLHVHANTSDDEIAQLIANQIIANYKGITR